jgi:hypothetical protein
MNNGTPSSPAAMKGREPFRLHGGRLDAGDRQARRGKSRRDRVGADAPVRHPEQDEHASAGRNPSGERHDHFHRRGRAGDQPRNGGKPQEDPGGAPPRTAKPRRGGHRTGRGGGKNRRARQRRSGKPRPWAAASRQSAGTRPARKINDADQHRARQDGAGRQADEQPEPAVAQRDNHRGDGRGGEEHLHEPGQHPARHGGRCDSSHGSSAGTRIGGMGGDADRQRSGEYKPGDDQADHVA